MGESARANGGAGWAASWVPGIKFIHSAGGRGAGRSRLGGPQPHTHPARSRPAAPGAPRPRPARTPAGREPLSAGAPGPGGGDWDAASALGGGGGGGGEGPGARRRGEPWRQRGLPAPSAATCTERRGRAGRGGEAGGGGGAGPRCPSLPASAGSWQGCPPRPQSPCRCTPTPRGQVHSGPRLRPLPAAAWGARVGALAPARGGLGVREFSIRFFLGPRSAQGFSH